MSLFGTIFGRRTQCAASSSIPMIPLHGIACAVASSIRAFSGEDVVVYEVANTNSMLPTFDANALILAEKCAFELLREGDIVTRHSVIQAPGKIVVHRLNQRSGNGWWPLGDGNGMMDNELVTPENFDRRVCGILYGAKDSTTDT